MRDPTQRFSDRVANYVKYRPGYPPALLDLLRAECGLMTQSVIADIGSGTGILTRLFLDNGNRVFAVEPNKDMREAAERWLGRRPGFVSIDGRAEDTGLSAQSVDFITAGQAFHWFDRERTKPEFQRVLQADGWCAIVWNDRKVEATPFQTAYQGIIDAYSIKSDKVDHRDVTPEIIAEFLRPGSARRRVLPNAQRFDFQGVKGRLLSSSYMPNEEDPTCPRMIADLKAAFDQHAENGMVTFDYDTVVFHGRFSSDKEP